MEVKTVGQTTYKILLAHDLHRWKGIGVWNTIKGVCVGFWTPEPQKTSLNASKWIWKVLNTNFPNWDLPLK
jgi:hypothetical protein